MHFEFNTANFVDELIDDYIATYVAFNQCFASMNFTLSKRVPSACYSGHYLEADVFLFV